MMKSYLLFDFGKSYFRDVSVLQLIKEKLPVSISLGIWMLLITYLVSIIQSHKISKYKLIRVDHSVHTSMKNAAKCVILHDLQTT